MNTNPNIDPIVLDADTIMDLQDQLMTMIDSSDPLDMRLAVLSIVRDLDMVVCRLQDQLPLRSEDLLAVARGAYAVSGTKN